VQKSLSQKTRMTLLIPAWIALLALPQRSPAEEIEFTYQNSLDHSTQKAVAYVPKICKTRSKNPLLVVAHYMGGSRYTAKEQGFYSECESRGCLLVCPELHGRRTGGSTSLAALEAQHDILDSINYMKQNFQIDSSRIFIDGRSMGGTLAAIMAAKYPDLFAAAVAGQGIYDLELWSKTALPFLKANLEKECGPVSKTTRFDYQRRSALSYAPNFQYVPLILWHGTNDTWVAPQQSELLFAAIKKFNRFQSDIHWLQNAPHCAVNYPPRWICDQLQDFQNTAEAGTQLSTRFYPELNFITDESQRFFWLTVTPANPTAFAAVHASLKNNTLTLQTQNVKSLTVNLDNISRLITFSKFDLQSDSPLTLIITKAGKTVFETKAKKTTSCPLPNF
jgi:poly(3-hydroxybutyrate) depolymerase